MVIGINGLFSLSCPPLFGSLDRGKICKWNCLSCQHPFIFVLKVSLQIKAISSGQDFLQCRHLFQMDIIWNWCSMMFMLFCFLGRSWRVISIFFNLFGGLLPSLLYIYKSRVCLHLRLRERNLFPVRTVQKLWVWHSQSWERDFVPLYGSACCRKKHSLLHYIKGTKININHTLVLWAIGQPIATKYSKLIANITILLKVYVLGVMTIYSVLSLQVCFHQNTSFVLFSFLNS